MLFNVMCGVVSSEQMHCFASFLMQSSSQQRIVGRDRETPDQRVATAKRRRSPRIAIAGISHRARCLWLLLKSLPISTYCFILDATVRRERSELQWGTGKHRSCRLAKPRSDHDYYPKLCLLVVEIAHSEVQFHT